MKRLAWAATLLAGVLWSTTAFAQFGSTGTGSSRTGSMSGANMFGTNRTLGGTLSGGTRTFGGTSTRGASGGVSSGLAGGGMTGGGFGGGMTGSQMGMTGQMGMGGAQNFIGAGGNLLSTLYGTTGGSQTATRSSSRSSRSTTSSRSSRRSESSGRGGRGQDAARTVAVQHVIGFSAPGVGSIAPSELETRITRALGTRILGDFQVQTSGRTVRLEGVVASAHDRDLAAQVALLTPGVSAIENNLIVAEATGP